FFLVYKRVVNRIVSIIEQVNPEYSFAKSLASTIIEGSLHQHFLKEHLKTITNCNQEITPTDFYLNLITTLFKK
ncbi:TetR/AcrR family transcriptional regulator, partial [Flavobacterium psychrophilum]|nr:TetR/AcrR family transcriptional regulator [Flavobacterium psychrophilum]